MSDPVPLHGTERPYPREAKPWDVFIAYASRDEAAAKALFQALRAGGCHPFLAIECLELGCDWDTETAQAQRQSLLTVVLVSSRTPEAHFQREEILAATELAKSRETRHRVIPVWLDGFPTEHDLVPYGLRIKHGIALGRGVTLQVVAARIIQSVGRSTGRRQSLFRMPAVPAHWSSAIASLPRIAYPIAAALAAAAAVRVLGQLAHEARESILGVPLDRTSYPEAELWQTGLRAAGGLLTSALFDLWAGENAERWGGPIAAALAAGWVLLARSRFRRASFVLLPTAAVALAVGVLSYTIAVKVSHVVVPGGGSESTCTKAITLTDRISFEVCSWLENGTELNGRRRAALEGLWGWLLAAICVAGTASARKWVRERSGDRPHFAAMHGILGAACVLMGLFLLRQAPRAYALGTWGLKYSRITGIEGPCLPGLQKGLLSGECRAWDVSGDAQEQILLLIGKNCGAGASDGSVIHAWVGSRAELAPPCRVSFNEGHIFGDR